MNEPGLFELFTRGVSVEEIAERYHLSAEGVIALVNRGRQNGAVREHKQRGPQGNIQRRADILEEYRSGETLADIGEQYGITRERVRQIIKVEVAKQLGIRKFELAAKKDLLDLRLEELKQESASKREGQFDVLLKQAEDNGLKPEYFTSASGFANAVGVSMRQLQTNRPEIIKMIQQARRAKWSTHYDRCRMCGSTQFKHKAMGYCENCYSKSEYFKELQRKSYFNNIEKRHAQNKEYRERYMAKPEVKERLEREYDEKFFGGNRAAVEARDGKNCTRCGMSNLEMDTLGRTKVGIYHINGDKTDHRLDNLLTLCRGCWAIYFNKRFRGASQRSASSE